MFDLRVSTDWEGGGGSMFESDSSVDSTAPSDSEDAGVETGEERGNGEGRTIHPAPIVQFDSTTR